MTDAKFDELLKRIEAMGESLLSSEVAWKHGWKNRLKDSYENARHEAKKHTRNVAELLDRHKVASLVMVAVIRCDPFEKLVAVVTPRDSMARFWLAFVTGNMVLRSFIREDIKDGSDDSPMEMIQTAMVFPPTMNGDGNYVEQTVRGLYQAHMNGKLDTFLLANMLFMMDSYHRLAWKRMQ